MTIRAVVASATMCLVLTSWSAAGADRTAVNGGPSKASSPTDTGSVPGVALGSLATGSPDDASAACRQALGEADAVLKAYRIDVAPESPIQGLWSLRAKNLVCMTHPAGPASTDYPYNLAITIYAGPAQSWEKHAVTVGEITASTEFFPADTSAGESVQALLKQAASRFSP